MPAQPPRQTSWGGRRILGATAAVAAAAVCGAAAWEFAGIVRRTGPAPPGIDEARLTKVRTGDSTDRVQALLGAPELTSDLYRAPHYLVQCWYYDVRSAARVEVCFDHWRVYHTERYP